MADENEQVDNPTEEAAEPARSPYASRLQLNSEEFEGEGTRIDRRKALELLISRLPKTNVYNNMIPHVPGAELSMNSDSDGGFFRQDRSVAPGAPGRGVIARKILEAIPEEMLTEELLTEGDIRPFMLAIIAETDAESGGQVGRERVTVQDRAVISWILQDETEQVRQQTEFALTSLVDPSDPNAAELLEQARVTAENYSMQYRDGVINRTQQYALNKDGKFKNEEVAKQSAAEQFMSENNPSAVGQTPYRFLSGEQLQRMLQSDQISFDDMISMQDRPVERTDEFGNVISIDRIDAAKIYYSPESQAVQRSGPNDPTIPRRNDWYSVTDIMRKPFEMSREEAINISKKMERAGIFDVVGGKPVVDGDVSDPQFQAAWKQLASMSLEQGKPMTSILEDRESAYQASLEAALAVSLTDPARLRLNGDAFARDAIGRKLNPEEQQAMVKFLHDLERKNARIAAGLDVTATGEEIDGVDALDEGITADIDARMQEWVEQTNPGEAGARDIAEQYDSFARLLGGPGRGVS